ADRHTLTPLQNPQLTLQKPSSPTSYDSVGDTISYSYAVTNSGNVSLAGPVAVTDDKVSVTCPPDLTGVGNGDSFLDPGETATCTAIHTVTQADLDAGRVTNNASAHAGGVVSNTAQPGAAADHAPHTTLRNTAV